jgi:hypothetical protein
LACPEGRHRQKCGGSFGAGKVRVTSGSRIAQQLAAPDTFVGDSSYTLLDSFAVQDEVKPAVVDPIRREVDNSREVFCGWMGRKLDEAAHKGLTALDFKRSDTSSFCSECLVDLTSLQA